MQPQIHLIDETWIAAPPAVIAEVVADPDNWPKWWPGLQLTVTRNRGIKGMQWAARGDDQPVLAGTAEVWIEPFAEGAIVHHYLRLDPVGRARLSRRRAARTQRRFAWQAKRAFWPVKDELERAGRSGTDRTRR